MLAAGWSREQLFCRLPDSAPPGFVDALDALVARREKREPMAYIRGSQEFWGLDFEVNDSVLIPRPETEMLVERAIALAAPHARLADVGTGSGNIAVSIARDRTDVRIIAIDLSDRALAVAARNAARHGVGDRVECVRGSLLECAAPATLDMIVANLPYVAELDRASLMEEVRDHEPALALFSGESGMSLIEALLPQAARVLKAGGWLLAEMGLGQSAEIQQKMASPDWSDAVILQDLQGIDRVLCARRSE